MDLFSVIRKEAASGNNLSCRQIAILSFVYKDNMHKSVIDYSKKLQISKPAVTRALDRLEELNLIQRNTNKTDRRMIFVTPTENGQKYFNNLIIHNTEGSTSNFEYDCEEQQEEWVKYDQNRFKSLNPVDVLLDDDSLIKDVILFDGAIYDPIFKALETKGICTIKLRRITSFEDKIVKCCRL